MDFGLFSTWNAVYANGKVPWDPEYSGGRLLEEQAYAKNFEEIDAIESGGWDSIASISSKFLELGSFL